MTDSAQHFHQDEELVAAYVAGTLPAGELSAFEVHLLGCTACQADVREAAALRVALRDVGPHAARTPDARVRIGFVWPSIAAAAMLALAVYLGGSRAPDLGAIDATPRFAGANVRGAADSATRQVDAALEAYAAADWSRARALLAPVLASDFHPALAFFAGHAAIADGSPRDAIPLLRRVLSDSTGDRRGIPYREDARYLLAKAWLRLGQSDSALAALRPSSAATARALADSITVQRGR